LGLYSGTDTEAPVPRATPVGGTATLVGSRKPEAKQQERSRRQSVIKKVLGTALNVGTKVVGVPVRVAGSVVGGILHRNGDKPAKTVDETRRANETSRTSTDAPGGPDLRRKVVPDPTHEAPIPDAADQAVPGTPVAPDATALPIVGYAKLSAEDIGKRLDGLKQSDLATVYKFEKANKNRKSVLSAIDSRLVDLPLPLYDSMALPTLLDALNGLTVAQLQTVREYEVRTENRLPLIERIDELLAVPIPDRPA